MNYTNEELLAVIKRYQEFPFVHELTCGNNSGHSPLKGIEIKGKVWLICPDCDYRQGWVPEFVWTVDAMKEALEANPEWKGMYEDDRE